MEKKKLIEVALPLEAINEASAREKSIRHGHPSTLHLWWARRPLAAARAVIWSSLVDDPSSHPEQFPTEEEQAKERERLFKILEDLVVWENSNDKRILDMAKAEIMKSTDGDPPALLDPFAGGGAIPLEAQRLGLEAHAHDLNPVAVMINKAMIEIPPRFADMQPVNPEANSLGRATGYVRAGGLAEDVRYYGDWMKKEAFKRIGHLYPKVKDKNGEEHTVIAWIWARTVKCPNPACGCQMPLVKSFDISKKKGNEAWVEPIYIDNELTFKIHHEGTSSIEGTIGRKGGICYRCRSSIEFPYIRTESREGRINSALMAIVAEGNRGRIYLPPSEIHLKVADISKPENYPEGKIAYYPGCLNTNNYGLDEFHKLFTNRQLTALTTFSELVGEAQKEAEKAALAAGYPDDDTPLRDGGKGAKAYGEAVGVYLAFVIDKMSDYHSSICSWHSSRELIRNTFGRQAIPMVWDFVEANPYCNSSGSCDNMLEWVIKTIQQFPLSTYKGIVRQFDAQSDNGLRNIMVSSDPPYYDNVPYADLADFFYIWMRQALKGTYPNLFRTMLVPKAEELVASTYRNNGNKEKAKEFFEHGMFKTCQQIYKYSREDIPVTIYYAYKQSDSDNEGTASTGWETMLTSIIKARFIITGTIPMRTEMATRMRSMGSNALASSIVLVCRKRPEDAPTITRRNFVNELKRELKSALQKLQQSNIAPVDLAQSAIGPGMGVYSKYAQVLEADGTPMNVRSALQIINQELDIYFNEQDGELDKDSRFCVELYTQYAFNDIKFGEADTLARAKNTSVGSLERKGILYAQKGIVHLIDRESISMDTSAEVSVWHMTQMLARAMETDGIQGCARIIAAYPHNPTLPDKAKDLAYRLYTIAERKGWTAEAYAYNSLVVSWHDISNAAAEIRNSGDGQLSLF